MRRHRMLTVVVAVLLIALAMLVWSRLFPPHPCEPTAYQAPIEGEAWCRRMDFPDS
jgi:hypothetical protein